MSVATPDVIPGTDITDMPDLGGSANCDITDSAPEESKPRKCIRPAVCRVRISCTSCKGGVVYFICQFHLETVRSGHAACATCMKGRIFIKDVL